MELPWTKVYEPKKMAELEGQDESLKQVKDFIIDFKRHKNKAALLYGPTGSGKTCSVHAVAHELAYEVFELNASDTRNKGEIESVLGGAVKQQSFFFKGKVILVDEIDALSGMQDRGGVSALASLIDKTTFPMFLTATDPFDKKLAPIRKKSMLIQFNRLDYISIFNVLKRVCNREKIRYEPDVLKSLARRAGGDLRAAITDLQALAEYKKTITKADVDELSQREQVDSIINSMVKILKTTDPSIAVTAFDNIQEGTDQQFLWIDENMPIEYKKPADLARAYDFISKADVMRRRIRRWQYWRFLVYINAFLTAGVAVSKDEKYKDINRYRQTMRLLKLWQAKMKYQKRKAIAEKIAEKTHSSTKEVIRDMMPYLQFIFKKNKEMGNKIADSLALDEEEVEWLKK